MEVMVEEVNYGLLVSSYGISLHDVLSNFNYDLCLDQILTSLSKIKNHEARKASNIIKAKTPEALAKVVEATQVSK